jgi:hypothetical protein
VMWSLLDTLSPFSVFLPSRAQTVGCLETHR